MEISVALNEVLEEERLPATQNKFHFEQKLIKKYFNVHFPNDIKQNH